MNKKQPKKQHGNNDANRNDKDQNLLENSAHLQRIADNKVSYQSGKRTFWMALLEVNDNDLHLD